MRNSLAKGKNSLAIEKYSWIRGRTARSAVGKTAGDMGKNSCYREKQMGYGEVHFSLVAGKYRTAYPWGSIDISDIEKNSLAM